MNVSHSKGKMPFKKNFKDKIKKMENRLLNNYSMIPLSTLATHDQLLVANHQLVWFASVHRCKGELDRRPHYLSLWLS